MYRPDKTTDDTVNGASSGSNPYNYILQEPGGCANDEPCEKVTIGQQLDSPCLVDLLINQMASSTTHAVATIDAEVQEILAEKDALKDELSLLISNQARLERQVESVA